MDFAVCFTNFGPYHLARLRALAARLHSLGGRLIAYEVAGREATYPWERRRAEEPFAWVTLFPNRVLETLTAADCRAAVTQALERDQPDALAIVGYARPESMAAVRWARRRGRPAILMSESQAIDRPRCWWKELEKRRRVRLFDAALVGGPSHRDYLVQLGMDRGRIAFGYNAVDNAFFRDRAASWRAHPTGRTGLPPTPYFLTVCRFVPEKNLVRLITAFARYRQRARDHRPWDLVLCGDGPDAKSVDAAVRESGCAASIHRPGFLQADALARWYAFASAFVLPSVCEPWGLVANEAAAAGLPLLLSQRAGCASTLIPEGPGAEPTGARFDPFDPEDIRGKLAWMAGLPEDQRAALGLRAAEVVDRWGPERFAEGILEALEQTRQHRHPWRKPSLLETVR